MPPFFNSRPKSVTRISMFWTQAKRLSKFQSELRIPNVCKSNSNSNFKIEVQKFELRFTSLIPALNINTLTYLLNILHYMTSIIGELPKLCVKIRPDS